MTAVVRRISISLKVLLAFLFLVLFFGECLDGVDSIADWAVALSTIIMFNDLFVHIRLMNGQGSERWTLSSRIGAFKDKRSRKVLILMNLSFFIILFGSILLDTFVVSYELRGFIVKSLFIVWSGVFLASNIMELKERFNVSRFIFTNVALMFLIGSLTL